VSRAERRAAADQLRTLGLTNRMVRTIESSGQILPSLPITANLAGTVIERTVTPGQVVQPSDNLFVITDLSTLWAVADVPEQEATQVRNGQSVEIEVPALGGQAIVGRIVYIADVVNPETRTVRVGVVVDNPQRVLKPAMLTTMRIEARRAQRQLIPQGAVVREKDEDQIFVVDGQGVATLLPIRLAPQRGDQRALLERLPADTRIVLDGAFHLNNERQRRLVDGNKAAS
jgi:membrane fusion protein, heavy metal efflux system